MNLFLEYDSANVFYIRRRTIKIYHYSHDILNQKK